MFSRKSVSHSWITIRTARGHAQAFSACIRERLYQRRRLSESECNWCERSRVFSCQVSIVPLIRCCISTPTATPPSTVEWYEMSYEYGWGMRDRARRIKRLERNRRRYVSWIAIYVYLFAFVRCLPFVCANFLRNSPAIIEFCVDAINANIFGGFMLCNGFKVHPKNMCVRLTARNVCVACSFCQLPIQID